MGAPEAFGCHPHTLARVVQEVCAEVCSAKRLWNGSLVGCTNTRGAEVPVQQNYQARSVELAQERRALPSFTALLI